MKNVNFRNTTICGSKQEHPITSISKPRSTKGTYHLQNENKIMDKPGTQRQASTPSFVSIHRKDLPMETNGLNVIWQCDESNGNLAKISNPISLATCEDRWLQRLNDMKELFVKRFYWDSASFCLFPVPLKCILTF
ncbi:hypothetical protein CEXT_42471 [Caerostris extrusa]|uniref:Uncharacterized protein n=1 Tax=Caerostris extrusa TaxID=172846 RepID=A0AAV4M8W4_CAEEX|nr:hypothetical protein CEXT_42471 [Caerostris extrusa]